VNKLIGLLLLFPVVAFSAPVVTGIGGIVGAGETLTIHGSGFGTKSPAAPSAWAALTENEYSGLSHGDLIPTQDDDACADCLYETRGIWGYPPALWTSSSDLRHHGNPVISTRYGTFQMARDLRQDTGASSSDKTYVFWYLRTNASYYQGPGGYCQTKVLRVWSTNAGTGSGRSSLEWEKTMVKTHSTNCLNDAFVNDYVPNKDLLPVRNKWYGVELYLDMTNGTESGGGIMQQSVDNVIVTTRSDLSACPSYKAHHVIWQMGAGSNAYSNLDQDARIWWTDVYMDITPARVMIGNRDTWAASDHREICIPTAWASGEISVTVNTGSFADKSLAFLYVFDSNNANNATGYPVTISSEYDPPPPATTITRPDSLKVE